ncbi:MAG: molybdopterin molybdotransferase MoeA [Thermoanaerobaculia bacterium]
MPTFQKEREAERMLPVEEAQARVLDAVRVLGTEVVPLGEAIGRVLREDVRAIRDVPLRDNSAMDGYAVLASDVEGPSKESPARLRVVEDVPAGRLATRRVEPGTAVRIMTGALLPEGADVVVPVELTNAGSELLEVHRPVRAGANIRRRGEDMREGEIVLTAGTRILAGDLGVLASVQKTRVEVGLRPDVAILSTGDEVIEADAPFEPGKVVNSNSWTLAALAAETGAQPRRLGIVADTLEETKEAIRGTTGAEFVLSTGGVSVGAFDFVKDALDELGAETKFWQVAMKPGKPLVLSELDGRLYFGLPGNPVSCMVSFILFVGPAIRKAAGESGGVLPPIVRMRTAGALRSRGDRRQYVRVRVIARGGELVAEPVAAQGSGQTTSMVGVNGFAIVETGTKLIEAGAMVDVVLFGIPFAPDETVSSS